MKTRSVFLRAISLIVVTSFIGEQLALAAPAVNPSKLDLFSKPKVDLGIPTSVAGIEDAWFGGEGWGMRDEKKRKTIYLIQDAHTNFSGQLNVARTLDHLFNSPLTPHVSSLKYVFLEAGSGDESLSFLRKYADLKDRQRLSESFLRQAKLQGSEYFDLTSDREFVLWGVEDLPLYAKSIEAYKEVVRDREKFQTYLKKVEVTIEALKPKIFSPMLLTFDSEYRKFKKEELSLTEYFDILTTQAEIHSVSLKNYPHLTKLKALKDKETNIDFKKASEEQQKAIEALSQSDQKELFDLAQKERKPFRLSSNDHKEDKAFYTMLESVISRTKENVISSPAGWRDEKSPFFRRRTDPPLAEKAEISRFARNDKKGAYPNLSKYFSYLKEAKALDPAQLLKEQKALESEIYQALATRPDELNLIRSAKNLEILKKLLNLTLTPDEWETYQKDKETFSIKSMTGFLNKKIMDLHTYYDRAVFLEDGYETIIQKAGEFYDLTYTRDQKFVQNTLKKMDQENQTHAVLITGGFHSPNLKYLLKQQNVSFVNITPQVFEETNQARYEERLLGQVDALRKTYTPNLVSAFASNFMTPKTATDMEVRAFRNEVALEMKVTDPKIFSIFADRYEALAKGLAGESAQNAPTVISSDPAIRRGKREISAPDKTTAAARLALMGELERKPLSGITLVDLGHYITASFSKRQENISDDELTEQPTGIYPRRYVFNGINQQWRVTVYDTDSDYINRIKIERFRTAATKGATLPPTKIDEKTFAQPESTIDTLQSIQDVIVERLSSARLAREKKGLVGVAVPGLVRDQNSDSDQAGKPDSDQGVFHDLLPSGFRLKEDGQSITTGQGIVKTQAAARLALELERGERVGGRGPERASDFSSEVSELDSREAILRSLEQKNSWTADDVIAFIQNGQIVPIELIVLSHRYVVRGFEQEMIIDLAVSGPEPIYLKETNVHHFGFQRFRLLNEDRVGGNQVFSFSKVATRKDQFLAFLAQDKLNKVRNILVDSVPAPARLSPAEQSVGGRLAGTTSSPVQSSKMKVKRKETGRKAGTSGDEAGGLQSDRERRPQPLSSRLVKPQKAFPSVHSSLILGVHPNTQNRHNQKSSVPQPQGLSTAAARLAASELKDESSKLKGNDFQLPPFNSPLSKGARLALVLARKLNESIILGDSVEVKVLEIQGKQVFLGVDAPRNIDITRDDQPKPAALSSFSGAGLTGHYLIVARKVGELFWIGDKVSVKVVDIRGGVVKLGTEAPKELPVHRNEVFEGLQKGNMLDSEPQPRTGVSHEPAVEGARLSAGQAGLAIEQAVGKSGEKRSVIGYGDGAHALGSDPTTLGLTQTPQTRQPLIASTSSLPPIVISRFDQNTAGQKKETRSPQQDLRAQTKVGEELTGQPDGKNRLAEISKNLGNHSSPAPAQYSHTGEVYQIQGAQSSSVTSQQALAAARLAGEAVKINDHGLTMHMHGTLAHMPSFVGYQGSQFQAFLSGDGVSRAQQLAEALKNWGWVQNATTSGKQLIVTTHDNHVLAPVDIDSSGRLQDLIYRLDLENSARSEEQPYHLAARMAAVAEAGGAVSQVLQEDEVLPARSTVVFSMPRKATGYGLSDDKNESAARLAKWFDPNWKKPILTMQRRPYQGYQHTIEWAIFQPGQFAFSAHTYPTARVYLNFNDSYPRPRHNGIHIEYPVESGHTLAQGLNEAWLDPLNGIQIHAEEQGEQVSFYLSLEDFPDSFPDSTRAVFNQKLHDATLHNLTWKSYGAEKIVKSIHNSLDTAYSLMETATPFAIKPADLSSAPAKTEPRAARLAGALNSKSVSRLIVGEPIRLGDLSVPAYLQVIFSNEEIYILRMTAESREQLQNASQQGSPPAKRFDLAYAINDQEDDLVTLPIDANGVFSGVRFNLLGKKANLFTWLFDLQRHLAWDYKRLRELGDSLETGAELAVGIPQTSHPAERIMSATELHTGDEIFGYDPEEIGAKVKNKDHLVVIRHDKLKGEVTVAWVDKQGRPIRQTIVQLTRLIGPTTHLVRKSTQAARLAQSKRSESNGLADGEVLPEKTVTTVTLKGSAGGVSAIAFLPDGKTLASASFDQTLKLWSVKTRKEKTATINGHTGEVSAIAFSPDGKTLAWGSRDDTVKLWGVETQEEKATLTVQAGGVSAIAFSPDGKKLATGSWDQTVKLWDLETREKIATLRGHTDGVRAIAFSPDGKMLASGSFDQTVKLWNVETRTEKATLKGHTDKVSAVAFSPDGKMLASGSFDRTVKLWDIEAANVKTTLRGHTDGVRAIAFSPDGKTLASGSFDRTLKLWDVDAGTERTTLKGHTGAISAATFSPDGKTLASASDDKYLRLWFVREHSFTAAARLAGTPVQPPGMIGLLVVPDRTVMAEEIALRIVERVREKPDVTLGLVSGRTMEPVFEEILRIFKADPSLDFSQVSTFNSDEYLGLGLAHQKSYRYAMEQKLFQPLREIDPKRAFQRKNTHFLNGLAKDSEGEIRRFLSKIDQEKEGIELQILGIGTDTHYAFYQPAVDFDPDLARKLDHPLDEMSTSLKKIRDLNEFILDEEIDQNELSGLILKLLSIRKRERTTLGKNAELVNRLREMRPRSSRTTLSDADLRDELNKLGKRLRKESEATFYVPNLTSELDERLKKVIRGKGLGEVSFKDKSEFFTPRARVVNLTVPTILYNSRSFDRLEDVPLKALTLTEMVQDAGEIILAAFGQEKADAIRDTLEQPISPDYTSSVLQKHSRTFVIVDQAAANKIDPNIRATAKARYWHMMHGEQNAWSLIRTLITRTVYIGDRIQAAQELASLGEKANLAVPALIQVLKKHPDPRLQSEVVLALARIGKGAFPNLLEALRDENGDTRLSATEAIHLWAVNNSSSGQNTAVMKQDAAAVIPVLHDLAERDPVAQVQMKASLTLRQIGVTAPPDIRTERFPSQSAIARYQATTNHAKDMNLVIGRDVRETGIILAVEIIKGIQEWRERLGPDENIVIHFATGDTPWLGYVKLVEFLRTWDEPSTKDVLIKYGVSPANTAKEKRPDMSRVTAFSLDSLFPQARTDYHAFPKILNDMFKQLGIPEKNQIFFYGDAMGEKDFEKFIADTKKNGLLLNAKGRITAKPGSIQHRVLKAMRHHARNMTQKIESLGGAHIVIAGVGPSYEGQGHVAFMESGTPIDQKAFIGPIAYHVAAGQSKENSGMDRLYTEDKKPRFGFITFGWHELLYRKGTLSDRSDAVKVIAIATGAPKSVSVQKALETADPHPDRPVTPLTGFQNSRGVFIVDTTAGKDLRIFQSPWEFERAAPLVNGGSADPLETEELKRFFIRLARDTGKKIRDLVPRDAVPSSLSPELRRIAEDNLADILSHRTWHELRDSVATAIEDGLVTAGELGKSLNLNRGDKIVLISPHLDDDFLAGRDLIRAWTKDYNVSSYYLTKGFTAVHDSYAAAALETLGRYSPEFIDEIGRISNGTRTFEQFEAKVKNRQTVLLEKLVQTLRAQSLHPSQPADDYRSWNYMSEAERKIRANLLFLQLNLLSLERSGRNFADPADPKEDNEQRIHEQIAAMKIRSGERLEKALLDTPRKVEALRSFVIETFRKKASWGSTDLEIAQEIKTSLRVVEAQTALMSLGVQASQIHDPLTSTWYQPGVVRGTAEEKDIEALMHIFRTEKPALILVNGEGFPDYGAHSTTEASTIAAVRRLLEEPKSPKEPKSPVSGVKILQYAGVWERIPVQDAQRRVIIPGVEMSEFDREFRNHYPSQAPAAVPDSGVPEPNYFSDEVRNNARRTREETDLLVDIPARYRRLFDDPGTGILNYKLLDIHDSAVVENFDRRGAEMQRVRAALNELKKDSLHGRVPPTDVFSMAKELQAAKKSGLPSSSLLNQNEKLSVLSKALSGSSGADPGTTRYLLEGARLADHYQNKNNIFRLGGFEMSASIDSDGTLNVKGTPDGREIIHTFDVNSLALGKTHEIVIGRADEASFRIPGYKASRSDTVSKIHAKLLVHRNDGGIEVRLEDLGSKNRTFVPVDATSQEVPAATGTTAASPESSWVALDRSASYLLLDAKKIKPSESAVAGSKGPDFDKNDDHDGQRPTRRNRSPEATRLALEQGRGQAKALSPSSNLLPPPSTLPLGARLAEEKKGLVGVPVSGSIVSDQDTNRNKKYQSKGQQGVFHSLFPPIFGFKNDSQNERSQQGDRRRQKNPSGTTFKESAYKQSSKNDLREVSKYPGYPSALFGSHGQSISALPGIVKTQAAARLAKTGRINEYGDGGVAGQSTRKPTDRQGSQQLLGTFPLVFSSGMHQNTNKYEGNTQDARSDSPKKRELLESVAGNSQKHQALTQVNKGSRNNSDFLLRNGHTRSLSSRRKPVKGPKEAQTAARLADIYEPKEEMFRLGGFVMRVFVDSGGILNVMAKIGKEDIVHTFDVNGLAAEEGHQIVIGRAETASFQIPGDKPSKADTVSRRHATLVALRNSAGVEVRLIDLGSSNGTFVVQGAPFQGTAAGLGTTTALEPTWVPLTPSAVYLLLEAKKISSANINDPSAAARLALSEEPSGDASKGLATTDEMLRLLRAEINGERQTVGPDRREALRRAEILESRLQRMIQIVADSKDPAKVTESTRSLVAQLSERTPPYTEMGSKLGAYMFQILDQTAGGDAAKEQDWIRQSITILDQLSKLKPSFYGEPYQTQAEVLSAYLNDRLALLQGASSVSEPAPATAARLAEEKLSALTPIPAPDTVSMARENIRSKKNLLDFGNSGTLTVRDYLEVYKGSDPYTVQKVFDQLIEENFLNKAQDAPAKAFLGALLEVEYQFVQPQELIKQNAAIDNNDDHDEGQKSIRRNKSTEAARLATLHELAMREPWSHVNLTEFVMQADKVIMAEEKTKNIFWWSGASRQSDAIKVTDRTYLISADGYSVKLETNVLNDLKYQAILKRRTLGSKVLADNHEEILPFDGELNQKNTQDVFSTVQTRWEKLGSKRDNPFSEVVARLAQSKEPSGDASKGLADLTVHNLSREALWFSASEGIGLIEQILKRSYDGPQGRIFEPKRYQDGSYDFGRISPVDVRLGLSGHVEFQSASNRIEVRQNDAFLVRADNNIFLLKQGKLSAGEIPWGHIVDAGLPLGLGPGLTVQRAGARLAVEKILPPEIAESITFLKKYGTGSGPASYSANPQMAGSLREANRYVRSRSASESPLIQLADRVANGTFSPRNDVELILEALRMLEGARLAAFDFEILKQVTLPNTAVTIPSHLRLLLGDPSNPLVAELKFNNELFASQKWPDNAFTPGGPQSVNLIYNFSTTGQPLNDLSKFNNVRLTINHSGLILSNPEIEELGPGIGTELGDHLTLIFGDLYFRKIPITESGWQTLIAAARLAERKKRAEELTPGGGVIYGGTYVSLPKAVMLQPEKLSQKLATSHSQDLSLRAPPQPNSIPNNRGKQETTHNQQPPVKPFGAQNTADNDRGQDHIGTIDEHFLGNVQLPAVQQNAPPTVGKILEAHQVSVNKNVRATAATLSKPGFLTTQDSRPTTTEAARLAAGIKDDPLDWGGFVNALDRLGVRHMEIEKVLKLHKQMPFAAKIKGDLVVTQTGIDERTFTLYRIVANTLEFIEDIRLPASPYTLREVRAPRFGIYQGDRGVLYLFILSAESSNWDLLNVTSINAAEKMDVVKFQSFLSGRPELNALAVAPGSLKVDESTQTFTFGDRDGTTPTLSYQSTSAARLAQTNPKPIPAQGSQVSDARREAVLAIVTNSVAPRRLEQRLRRASSFPAEHRPAGTIRPIKRSIAQSNRSAAARLSENIKTDTAPGNGKGYKLTASEGIKLLTTILREHPQARLGEFFLSEITSDLEGTFQTDRVIHLSEGNDRPFVMKTSHDGAIAFEDLSMDLNHVYIVDRSGVIHRVSGNLNAARGYFGNVDFTSEPFSSAQEILQATGSATQAARLVAAAAFTNKDNLRLQVALRSKENGGFNITVSDIQYADNQPALYDATFRPGRFMPFDSLGNLAVEQKLALTAVFVRDALDLKLGSLENFHRFKIVSREKLVRAVVRSLKKQTIPISLVTRADLSGARLSTQTQTPFVSTSQPLTANPALSAGLVQVAVNNPDSLPGDIALSLDSSRPTVLRLELKPSTGGNKLLQVTSESSDGAPVLLDVLQVLTDEKGREKGAIVKTTDLKFLMDRQNQQVDGYLALVTNIDRAAPVSVRLDVDPKDSIFGDIAKDATSLELFAAEAYKVSKKDPNISYAFENSSPTSVMLAAARLSQLEKEMGLDSGSLTSLFSSGDAQNDVPTIHVLRPDAVFTPTPGARYLFVQGFKPGEDAVNHHPTIVIAAAARRLTIEPGEGIEDSFVKAYEAASGSRLAGPWVLKELLFGVAALSLRLAHSIKPLARIAMEYLDSYRRMALAFARAA